MTNIYTYCLFDGEDTFYGVYSSLKAIYRDAMQLSNRGSKPVQMRTVEGWSAATLTDLRNTLKGQVDIIIEFRSGKHAAKILKTRLKE